MIPERSEAAKFAKSVFFEQCNDIDVYVEDTAYGYEKVFVEVLSKVFASKYKISKVFPLGPREKVVERCKGMQGNFVRPSLFIVDGDLHMLAGDPVQKTAGLYILPFYCIENILIDSSAIHDVLNEEDSLKLRDQLIDEFAFENWIEGIRSPLSRLFLEYAISFKLNPPVQTVRFGISNLVSSGDGELDDAKVSQRIDHLRKSSIGVVGETTYLATRVEIEQMIESGRCDSLWYVSGKDYLFPLLKIRMRSIVKTRMPDINLKLRLAMKCCVRSLSGIEDAVVTVA